MNKIILAVFVLLSSTVFAQISTVSNNKPLGFLNPALQNYELNKGVISASYVLNPLVKEEVPGAFLAIGEFKITEAFRLGFNASQFENRLSKSSNYSAYASYRLELEKGNYLLFGADLGTYTDVTKLAEFNKVFSPNKFYYGSDSSILGKTTGLDLGFGVAYSYSGFTAGIGFSKINTPEVYPFPLDIYELKITPAVPPSTSPDTSVVLKDTTVGLEKGTFGLESNVNLIYEWNPSEKVKLTHTVHFGNIDLAGFDYAGFQNIAEINERHTLGAGVFYNGYLGYILTAGYGITKDIKIGATAFFQEDLNYNTTTRVYDNDGYKPAIEANLRFEF